VIEAAAQPARFRPLYDRADPLESKLETIARRVYGADGVELAPAARAGLEHARQLGLDQFPICMAKTHLSLSHDPALTNAPSGFTLPIRDLRPYTGAGWLLALCGDMQTMPGLGRHPAALDIDVQPDGRIVGLF
jgi:formate--tetrahydrofolate ligase